MAPRCISHDDAAASLLSELLCHPYGFIFVRLFEKDDAPLLRDIRARYLDNVSPDRKDHHWGKRKLKRDQ
jgi:hypothetical protein